MAESEIEEYEYLYNYVALFDKQFEAKIAELDSLTGTSRLKIDPNLKGVSNAVASTIPAPFEGIVKVLTFPMSCFFQHRKISRAKKLIDIFKATEECQWMQNKEKVLLAVGKTFIRNRATLTMVKSYSKKILIMDLIDRICNHMLSTRPGTISEDELMSECNLLVALQEGQSEQSAISTLTFKKLKMFNARITMKGKAVGTEFASGTTTKKKLAERILRDAYSFLKSISAEDERLVESVVGKVLRPDAGEQCLPNIVEGVATRHWNVQNFERVQWVREQNGKIPTGALCAGDDWGKKLYVIRAQHGMELIPGKLGSKSVHGYVGYKGKEHDVFKYEVLVVDEELIEWTDTTGTSEIPRNAIQGGEASDGEAMYIGRVEHDGQLTMGKVKPSDNCLFIPYGGQEVPAEHFQILVMKQPLKA